MDMRARRRELAAFFLRLACFCALALLLAGYATYVLTPKSDFGICSMLNLYAQPENTVDVLTVGTSLAFAGVNTNVLYTEYGIAAYNLCSAEQPFWVSYYALREALRTQRPQVILLDAKPATYNRDYSRRGRVILSTFGIRSPVNRAGAILACVESPQDALGFLLGLPQLHRNYPKVTAADFAYPPDNGSRGPSWKGYIEMDNVEQHHRPSLIWNSVQRSMNAREEEYARRIFELAEQEGIALLVVGFPNPDYAADHMYYNALFGIAREYGFSGLNYNDPTLRYGLRYTSDFADWQHLNVKGSVTLSRRLGEDLLSLAELPDRRGDAHYASYDECAALWYAKYPQFAAEKGSETDEHAGGS